MRKTQTIRPAPWQRLTVKLTVKPVRVKLPQCPPKAKPRPANTPRM